MNYAKNIMESNNPILFVKMEKYLVGSILNLSSSLSMFGYPVMVVDFPELESVTSRYVPVVTIAMLPGLPALDLKICHQLLRLIAAPIIVISSFDDSECRISAFDAGIADFLVAPVNPLELAARVKNILGRRIEINSIQKEPIFTH